MLLNARIARRRNMNTIRIGAVLLTCVALTAAAQGNQFRSDYTYYPEARGWIKFHKVPSTWSEARYRCHVEGAVIASPINEGLYSAMRSVMLTQTRAVFTGVHAVSKDLYSFDGVPLDQMPIQWAKGEPDNKDDAERCTAILPEGTFADVRCSEVKAFMCFKAKTGNEIMSECGTFASGYEYVEKTGSCYKFHGECVNWWRANMICAAEGARMVIINSELEAQVLFDKYATSPIKCDGERNSNAKRFIHAGFHNLDLERAFWFTLDGKLIEDAGYSRWKGGEPSSDHKRCGSLTRDNSGLNDIDCSNNIPFVCEITNPKIS